MLSPESIQRSAISLKPDLVLRVGFAGKRALTEAQTQVVKHRLRDIFGVIGWRLVEISPMDDADGERDVPSIARFYSDRPPTLRLISGLCEGADHAAYQVFMDEAIIRGLNKDFAAVVPFPLTDYRASRWDWFHKDFDRQAESASYILVADGIYDRKSEPDHTPEQVSLANRRRARGYRSQSALLLRQSDLIVAVVNPEEEGKPGGTFETVRSALQFELPVVLIHPDEGDVFLIEPGDDLLSILSHDPEMRGDWKDSLAGWVTQITADPERSQDAVDHESASHGLRLMNEFFDAPARPLRVTRRSRLWGWLQKRFERIRTKSPRDPETPAYKAWRDRATELSRYYSGLYRGTYVLNHVLAVSAVFLAALSLVLMGETSTQLAQWMNSAAKIGHLASEHAASDHSETDGHGLFRILLTLALLKLWIVVAIFRSTHAATHGEWNDRAVDFRYLSERLRAMSYLPAIGSYQPPAAAPAQYASRVVRQSAVDWLFDAIIRAASPAPSAVLTEVPRPGADPLKVRLIQLKPSDALKAINEVWIRSQYDYHRKNADTMQRFSHFLETWGKRFNIAVIATVTVDVVLVIVKLSVDLEKDQISLAKLLGAQLVFVAAVIPAAVAALNGIRFQSECQRLAERSSVMKAILKGRQKDGSSPGGRSKEVARLLSRIDSPKRSEELNPGSWTLETLHLGEKIAADFVHEIAEWSVLYAKEIAEP